MNDKNSNSILVPAPTAWPFMTALGISLIFTGLVTHAIVGIVGACILLRAAIGWGFDVLPNQKEEVVAVTRVEPVAVSSAAVDYVDGGFRTQVPEEVHPYSSGFRGGL